MLYAYYSGISFSIKPQYYEFRKLYENEAKKVIIDKAMYENAENKKLHKTRDFFNQSSK